MAGELTRDISSDKDVPYMIPGKRNKGVSFDEWDFYGAFGRFEEHIVPVFAEAIEEFFEGETPFYFTFPFIEYDTGAKDVTPTLAFRIYFGFDDGMDAYIYESSIDDRIASEFGKNRVLSGAYDMNEQQVKEYQTFAAALRELADKIDVELTKVK